MKLLLFLLPLFVHAGDMPWNFADLAKTPKVYEAVTQEPGVKALYYESVPYRGQTTRVFAYYGAPEGKNLPAMVLIHGGGGTAFAEWVRMWNKRGYAAIAMDTCGNAPDAAVEGKKWNPERHHHEHGGPVGWGGFEAVDEPPSDQWSYHAVAAAVFAHSLIRSFPEIDPKRIGVTGISWGGYLTDIVSGVDPRFHFAAPVYGCGFLGEDSAWLKNFAQLGKDRAQRWLSLWDPSVYLPESKVPMLWVTGTNDFAYPFGSLQKSYRLPKGVRTLCIRVRMKHSHPDGAIPEEIFAFANAMTQHGDPLPKIVRASKELVEYKSKRAIVKAELNYTTDSGKWQERKWESIPAELDGKRHRVKAQVPANATVSYINLYDDRGLVVSSEHQ